MKNHVHCRGGLRAIVWVALVVGAEGVAWAQPKAPQVSGEGETSGFSRTQGSAGSTRGPVSGFNSNWDAIWKVAAQSTDRGWEAEFEIPFKTLRYSPGNDKTWGFNGSGRSS